jgi:hypothetical protein
MENKSAHLFPPNNNASAEERNSGTRTLKTWATPKVITSTLSEDTEASFGAGGDGGNGGGHS